MLFVTAGSVDWTWGWVYLGCVTAVLAVNTVLLPRDLIAERAEPKNNVKPWDKKLVKVAGFFLGSVFVVAGIDERSGLSQIFQTMEAHVAGILLFLLGNALFSWAMVSNRFFSTLVRIQSDRQHSVATGGPYRIVRHPGYVGYILLQLATPLILGSLWAGLPALALAVTMAWRTSLEDEMLINELQGYKEFAQRVRFRLIPGVW